MWNRLVQLVPPRPTQLNVVLGSFCSHFLRFALRAPDRRAFGVPPSVIGVSGCFPALKRLRRTAVGAILSTLWTRSGPRAFVVAFMATAVWQSLVGLARVATPKPDCILPCTFIF